MIFPAFVTFLALNVVIFTVTNSITTRLTLRSFLVTIARCTLWKSIVSSFARFAIVTNNVFVAGTSSISFVAIVTYCTLTIASTSYCLKKLRYVTLIRSRVMTALITLFSIQGISTRRFTGGKYRHHCCFPSFLALFWFFIWHIAISRVFLLKLLV